MKIAQIWPSSAWNSVVTLPSSSRSAKICLSARATVESIVLPSSIAKAPATNGLAVKRTIETSSFRNRHYGLHGSRSGVRWVWFVAKCDDRHRSDHLARRCVIGGRDGRRKPGEDGPALRGRYGRRSTS